MIRVCRCLCFRSIGKATPGIRAYQRAFTSGERIFEFHAAGYEAAVARVIDYVRAGDVFQVNLSQRFTVESSDSPAAIYSRLPPAAHGAFLDYGISRCCAIRRNCFCASRRIAGL